MPKLKLTSIVALVALAADSTPTSAGEITGSGKDITINGRSECAFSGRNDTPEGIPGVDPGGIAQSYGYFGGYWDLWDPQDADPQVDGFPPIPGYACNPNRGRDLHDE
jgi:hypothetical protein